MTVMFGRSQANIGNGSATKRDDHARLWLKLTWFVCCQAQQITGSTRYASFAKRFELRDSTSIADTWAMSDRTRFRGRHLRLAANDFIACTHMVDSPYGGNPQAFTWPTTYLTGDQHMTRARENADLPVAMTESGGQVGKLVPH